MSCCPISMQHDWPQALLRALQRGGSVVRIVVAQVRGSAPREPGAVMLVGPNWIDGTIGGGQLEWQALAAARTLLTDGSPAAYVQRLVLGTDLAQCCGGVVDLWLERCTQADRAWLEAGNQAARGIPVALRSTLLGERLKRELVRLEQAPGAAPQLLRATDGLMSLQEPLEATLPALWLYGAGHVGAALMRMLSELPLRMTWIDVRRELFPAALPGWVRTLCDDPLASVADALPGTHFRVITHSHTLDYALCRALLLRGDFASLGLIGSESKAARFRSRLTRDGIPAERIAQLICPIGISGIRSKWPAAVALSIAAQLMQQLGAAASANPRAPAAPIERCGPGDCKQCGSLALVPGGQASAR
jgi:xanthine dehydrogenase accessory factor